MTLLLNDTARRDPGNPILQKVADLLHPLDPSLPLNAPVPEAPELDALIRKVK
jgi:hypothetical protein